MTKRERRLINELQLLTGVMTEDIGYLCYLLLRGGTYFKDTKTEKEIEEEEMIQKLNDKVDSLGVSSFEDLLKTL